MSSGHNPTCNQCGSTVFGYEPKFCSNCGEAFPDWPPPYTGVPSDGGVYRLTFPPVEVEFDSRDLANETAHRTGWGRGGEGRFDSFEVEFVKTTVGPEKYPFVCRAEECDGYVSDRNDHRCSCCGNMQWERRVPEEPTSSFGEGDYEL